MTRWSFGRRGVCDGLKIHRTWFNSARLRNMVVVAQLARAPDCGSGGRGFESLHSPKREYSSVAERMAVNHRVVGSSPSIPASMEVWPRGLRRHPAKVLNSSRGSESSNLSASAKTIYRDVAQLVQGAAFGMPRPRVRIAPSRQGMEGWPRWFKAPVQKTDELERVP